MLQSRLAGFLAGLVILSVLWLVIASAAFLWLSGLWDDPRLVWWSRPWIWATYAPAGRWLIVGMAVPDCRGRHRVHAGCGLRALCRAQPGGGPAPPFWEGPQD
jgi:hypothetical protein